ncbi:acetyl-CoA C-acetyltransferase [Peterkaempfera bronchialis]|uniref:Acetyl-CoA C-acetyltransferase n=1 Tax=Peterkaempfera bronchialis TaxID=2126346 RepID=A0A345T5K2_9ACTN|nr:acetyl-CoA C-acetyltransferase [Peterkaempfera bronchialis]AXI81257.1 acetyl-CoA C-acetyltransferase [Peterkaempfera bronchialis]
MSEAYIVDAVRTPVGRRNGSLAGVHSADLGAHVLSALMDRTGIDPAAVEDVVFGCLDQLGSQSGDIARTSWLAAGLPESVPGVTIDRQCGSSQQAVHFAAQATMSGLSGLVVAGGVQNMSQIPLTAAALVGPQFGMPDPYSGSRGWRKRYGDQTVSQFHAAELMARHWDLSREEMEEFALNSHQRAAHAVDSGWFEREIAPYVDGETALAVDEGPRRDTSLASMARLKTLDPAGRITAATASQISDGAAALLIASEQAVQDHGLIPRARIHRMTVLGDDPIMMLSAPIPATRKALEDAGLTEGDIDAVEINEAFASVVLAWQREIDIAPERVNPVGGAIALGHPLGATGARLMTTLLHHLERTGGRYGLQTMCEGGGQANVTILERL